MVSVTRVRRFDRATLGKAIRLDNGFIRAPAKLARTGVLEYVKPDGSIQRELRLAEEVFSPASLDSFYLKPIVDDHPRENRGVVDARNARRLAVGTVGMPTRDGRFVIADLMLTDAVAAGKVEAGKREISCGYFCDREPAEPGAKWKDPESGDLIPYDFIQRNIVGNHVAIVDCGRAGPEVRISLDSAGDAVDESQTQTGVSTPKGQTMKFNIHGVDYEIDPSVAQAITEERKINADAFVALKDSHSKLKSDADKAQARADQADQSVKKLTTDLAAATDPKALNVAVAERVALETKANAILGADFKLDALSNAEIKVAAVKKSNPALALDGKSADYINCAFDLIDAKSVSDANPITQAARANLAGAPATTDAKPMNAADAKAKFNKAIFATDAADMKPARQF